MLRRGALAGLGTATAVVVLGVAACARARVETASNSHDYLFAYFKGNGEDGMHLAHSADGLTWRALRHDSAFFKPTVGAERLTRDPSVVRGPDGTYHMVWTAGWTERGFGYARSKDLITWTNETYVPVMAHEPTARNTWAPEFEVPPADARRLLAGE